MTELAAKIDHTAGVLPVAFADSFRALFEAVQPLWAALEAFHDACKPFAHLLILRPLPDRSTSNRRRKALRRRRKVKAMARELARHNKRALMTLTLAEIAEGG